MRARIFTHCVNRTYRILFITIFLIAFSVLQSAAAVRTYTKTASGTYSWAGNWGTNPLTGDDIIINPGSGATIIITGVPSISLKTMTIGATATTGTVILQSTSGVTITLTGTSSGVLICNSNLTLGASVNITLNNQTSATGTIGANKTLNVGANTFTWNNGGTLTVNSSGGKLINSAGGSIIFSYSGSQTLPQNMTIDGTLVLSSGSSGTKTWTSGISNTIGATGKLQIGGNGPAVTSGTAPSYTAGASLEYTSSATQNILTSDISSGSTGVNLIVSNSSTTGVSLNGTNRTFNNVTFTTGKLTISTATLTINGAITGMSSSNVFIGSATSNLYIGGTGACGSIYMSSSSTAAQTLLGLTINRTSSGTVTFSNAHRTATGGTYNLLAGTVTLTGALSLSSGTVFTRLAAGTISAAPGIVSGTYNLVYGNGVDASAITSGNELLTSTSYLNNLTINASGGVTLAASPTVNGTLTLTSGKLSIAANTLTLNGTVSGMSASACLTGGASSNLTIGGSGTLGTLYFDQTSTTTSNIATYTQNRSTTGIVNLGNRLNISTSFTFGTTGGLFYLGTANLVMGASATFSGTPSTTKMIVTNSTGQLVKTFATGNTSVFTFPVGEVTGTVEYSPVAVDYSANSVSRRVGINVVDGNPPGTLVTDYLSRYWVFTDDQGANSYTLTSMVFDYETADVNGTESNILPAGYNGSSWSPYPGSISTGMDQLTVTGTEATALLASRTITGRLTPPVYTWIATSGSADWQVASNWSPARSSVTANDVLQFTNGGTPTATNVPDQTIAALLISGNTSVTLVTATSASANLVISDGVAGSDLNVATGSLLRLSASGSYYMTVEFTSAGSPTAAIAGTLTVDALCWYDSQDCVTTLTGTLNNGGTVYLYSVSPTDVLIANSGGVFVNSGTISYASATSFIFNTGSTYQHNFTSGTIPTGAWNTGSTVEIIGAISAIPSGLGQTFYNFTWNSVSQSASVSLSSAFTNLVATGTFTMANSNGTLNSLIISPSYDIICGNYVQTGGRLNMSTSGEGLLQVSGNFTMSGGQINTTSSGSGLIEFNGTGLQTVNITGGTIAGVSASYPINYKVNGTTGITIPTGSTLTVGQGGTLFMTKGTVAGVGTLTYNATASTLVYNGATAQAGGAKEFPGTGGPVNLTINNATGVTLSASLNRSVPGTFVMTAGDIDLGSNTLTLGTSTSAPGTLNYTAGHILNGTFTRWFSTSGISTFQNTDPEFPMGVGTFSRELWFWRTGSFTAGGTIAVTFYNTSGLTAIPAFVDGSISIDKRTNQYWGISTSGWTGTGTLTMEVFWENAPFTISTASNLRLIQATAAVGSAGSNSGYTPDWYIQRTGITMANLTNNFYIGSVAANLASNIVSVATGNWNSTSTWNCGCLPGGGDNVTIASPHNVTVNISGAVADNVTINSGGTLTLNNAANSLTIGPACGGNRLLDVDGQLSISAGTLTVGGNVNITNFSSKFIMSGGSFYIDGNDGNLSSSVVYGTPLFKIGSITTLTITGGTITIVDPHYNTPNGSYGTYLSREGTAFQYGNGTSSWSGNTFVLGGSSCTNSSNTNVVNGFVMDCPSLKFGNLTVNGGTGTRVVSVTNYDTYSDLVVGGVLTINTGCTFQTIGGSYIGSSVYAAGNISNSGTINIVSGTELGLALCSSSFSCNATAAQTVSGSGTFTIDGDLLINNTASATPNVTFSTPITVSGNLTMYSGKVSIGVNDFTVNGTISGNSFGTTNMFIADNTGQFKRKISTAGYTTYDFPVGDNTGTLEYSPVQLYFASNASARIIGVRVVNGDPSNYNTGGIGSSYLHRHFYLTDNSSSAYNYSGYLQYKTADLVGTEADLNPMNWNGSAWASITGATINTTNHQIVFGSGTTALLNGTQMTGRTGPPPSNDACIAATALTITSDCTSPIPGTTASATNEGGLSSCSSTAKDVWYSFTSPANGTMRIVVTGATGFDPVLNLRTNATCPGASVICYDFTGNGATEKLNITGLAASTVYRIRVAAGASTGDFTICTSNAYTPAGNDNVSGAITANVGSTTGNANNNYGMQLGEPTGYDWFTYGSHPTNSQWFVFTPSTTSCYEVASTGFDTQLAIYTAGNVNNFATYSEVASDDDSGPLYGSIISAVTLNAGTTYYIQVNGFPYTNGTPTLIITNLSVANPVATAATNNGCTGFTANWSTVTNAAGYFLDVSKDNFSTFVTGYNNLNVNNVLTYPVNGLTSGTAYQYRVRAYGICSGTPVSGNSNIIYDTTFYAPLTPVFTAGAATLCAGQGSTYTATSAYATSISYSIVAGLETIDPITGVVGAVSGNFTVRATATNTCGTSTNDITVTVNPNPTVTVSTNPSPAEVCPLTPVILTGGGATTYSWAPATGLSATTGSPVTATLSNTTTYTVTGTALGCTDTATVTVTILVCGASWTGLVSADWNTPGNWSGNSVPMAATDVTIPSGTPNQPVISGSANCNQLSIASGAILTIMPHKSLTAYGNTTLNGAQCLVLKSSAAGTASFIDNGTIGGAGTAKIERYITANYWHYISSPVNAATAAVFSGQYLKKWLEPTYAWQSITSVSTPLAVMTGYALKSSLTKVYSFVGRPNTGNKTFNLTRNSLPSTGQRGWNLVGNPYPSAIDWDDNLGWTKSNVDGAIYIYNQTYGTYATYNYPFGTNGASNFIAEGQGFYVTCNTNPGSLIVNNHARVHKDTTFFKSSLQADIIRLTVHDGLVSDDLIVRIEPQSTATFDGDFDAYKIVVPGKSQLWSNGQGNVEYAINTLPDVQNNPTVPVSFMASGTGLFTIAASEFEQLNQSTQIYLEDLKTGVVTNLADSRTYEFYAAPGDDENRFMLHFDKPATAGIQQNAEAGGLSIYPNPNNGTFNLISSKATNGSIEVYNVLGERVYSQTATVFTSMQLDLSNLTSGVYYLSLKSGEGIRTLKFVVN